MSLKYLMIKYLTIKRLTNKCFELYSNVFLFYFFFKNTVSKYLKTIYKSSFLASLPHWS